MFTRQIVPRFAQASRSFSTTPANKLAKLSLIGRLADAPEVQATSTGRDVTKFALAVQQGARQENGQRDVNFYQVASFVDGPQREVLANTPKGALMYVEADVKVDRYEVDGSKRTNWNLVAKNFSILSRPRQDGNAGDPVQDPQSGLGAS